MPKSFSRIKRVESLIQAEIAQLIEFEFRDLSLGLVTITGVKVSPDLSQAKIFFTVHKEEKKEEILKYLKNESKQLRYLLGRQINLRRIPELCFYYDESIERGSRISRLLN